MRFSYFLTLMSLDFQDLLVICSHVFKFITQALVITQNLAAGEMKSLQMFKKLIKSKFLLTCHQMV